MLFYYTAVFCLVYVGGTEPSSNCRDRSNHLRQDGGLCFEIPPWQHQPVELAHHLDKLSQKWGNPSMHRRSKVPKLALVNSDITRYMDTVIAPFLDTYHRNIQSSYQQHSNKMLKRIKDEISAAIKKKLEIYNELTELAASLNVPAMCDEERRASRTVASRHVSQTYQCTKQARASIAKMGEYAEDMIIITKHHMQRALDDASKSMNITRNSYSEKDNAALCLTELSRAAVALGYELDLSLTNARRHNEQSCEKLTSCVSQVRRSTDEAVGDMRDRLYQCVYA